MSQAAGRVALESVWAGADERGIKNAARKNSDGVSSVTGLPKGKDSLIQQHRAAR